MALKAKDGLSPRGRGNHGTQSNPGVRRRSIPAWAGEPKMGDIAAKHKWVYPRVGGGTSLYFVPDSASRSIPAWAGEPKMGDIAAKHKWVYPRVGGGTRI